MAADPSGSQPPQSRDGACADISGRYAFWGTWERFDIVGAEQKSTAAFKSANPRPRLDRFGLGFVAAQVVEPHTVDLRLDRSLDSLQVDVQGAGIDPRGIDEPLRLPTRMGVRCQNGRWAIDARISSGGENVPTDTRKTLQLQRVSEAELLVIGEELVTSGWLFKRRWTQGWRARFARVGN